MIIYIHIFLLDLSCAFVNLQIRRKYTVQRGNQSFGTMNCELNRQIQVTISYLVKKCLHMQEVKNGKVVLIKESIHTLSSG